jgi:hypothetical protein
MTRARSPAGVLSEKSPNAVLFLERSNVTASKPHRHLDGDRCRVVGEHEARLPAMPLHEKIRRPRRVLQKL